MGNSLRCCIGCVLPCGALDLIRIVHLSGHVEEIHRPKTAGEVLKDNPGYVLSNPCSNNRRIVSPEMELKRGCIYFLIPDQSVQNEKKIKKKKVTNCSTEKEREIKEKRSRRDRRRTRVGVWRPHLDSIFED